MSDMYIIYQVDCETHQVVETEVSRLEYLVYLLGLPEDTTLEEAEAIAANDDSIPQPAEPSE